MPAIYRWWKVLDPGERESLEDRLLHIEASPIVIQDPADAGGAPWAEAYLDDLAAGQELQRSLGGELEPFEERDWLEESLTRYENQFHEISARLVVSLDARPAFLDDLASRFPDRVVLASPPLLAFGTGEHPTTAACLRWIDEFAAERESNTWRMLDLGSGSGLLALAAVRLGAASALGLENDERALRVAIEHRETHGVHPDQLGFELQDVLAWKPADTRYDLIAANLFSDLLTAVLPKLPALLAADGTLLLSGILTNQAPVVLETAKNAGFSLAERRDDGKWVSLRFHSR